MCRLPASKNIHLWAVFPSMLRTTGLLPNLLRNAALVLGRQTFELAATDSDSKQNSTDNLPGLEIMLISERKHMDAKLREYVLANGEFRDASNRGNGDERLMQITHTYNIPRENTYPHWGLAADWIFS